MRITKSLLVIGLCLAFTAPALAQMGGGQGMGGPGQGRDMGLGRGRGMMYNPQTVTTIQGTVGAWDPKGPRSSTNPGLSRPPRATSWFTWDPART